jgi:hypothetical protein
MVSERLGSYIDPQRAQFVIDSSDFGLGGGVVATVTIGNLGAAPHLTFANLVDSSTVAPILDGSLFQPQTLQCCALTSFQGGTTNHGMPDAGTITDIVTVNHNITDATGNYRSGMPVVSIYGDRNNGGVYFLPGDGALHPMSQAMGVHGLWYDESAPIIYAATEAGIYQHSPDPADTTPWARLGGMALPCIKVISSYGRVYALATFPANGTVHVLMYAGPGTGLPEPTKGYGYDDWQSVYSTPGLADFGVYTYVGADPSITTLYAISTNATGKIIQHILEVPSGTTGVPADSLIDLGGVVAVGLDCLVSYALAPNGKAQTAITSIFVRTDGGSSRMFRITGSGGVITLTGNFVSVPALGPASTTGLADAYGNPVQVNQIYQHSPGIITWDGGIAANVAILAATSAGIFANPNLNGSGVWQPTDGQSNLGDFNVDRVASAPPRQWLGQTLSQVWGVAGRSIYRSPNGTINWIDIMAKPLDGGPAFFAAYKKLHGSYPDNTATTLPWPAHGPNAGAYTVYRGLNGIGEFTYHMVNPTSVAPAGAHRFTELSQVASPSQVAEIASSGLVFDAMARFLAYTARAQLILEIHSRFTDPASPLRTLRPTHQAVVSGTVQGYNVGITAPGSPISFVSYSGLVCYVLEHTIAYDSEVDPNACVTTTRLGVLCLDDRSSPDKVDQDLWSRISRMALYNVAKR